MKLPRTLACTLALAVVPLSAQQKYTAGQIVFNHPGTYTQAQLEQAAGMHPGLSFTADDLAAAAQRLVDTGFFDNAGAALDGKYNAISVLFDIQPIERSRMLRVGYENFVWLTHAEIDSALHAKAPLFDGYLPETSPLKDVFDAALTDALAAKGVTAKVTHDTVEPTLHRPERTIEFRITSPSIQVAHVNLAGVSPDLAPLVQKSVNSVARTAFNQGFDGQTTEDAILKPLFDAGYLKASLSDVTVTPTLSGDTASVALSATLNPGDIYRVSSIAFAGTPLLSAESFAVSEKLHPGDIASRALLIETLAPLDAAYRRLGYMDVVIDTAPAIDSATHQVAYTISVVPGEQYRVHKITAKNLDAAARAEFDRGFLLKVGDLYNAEYLAGFLLKNSQFRSLQNYSGYFKAYADTNTHTVDVDITFIRVLH